eukprot:scaffold6987_cov72-Cyclotella_meneghiniana.AAC.15
MKTIYIHNFLELSKAKSSDNYVTSPNFECFGHKLILFVFPGGEGPRTTQDGWVVASIGNGSCANLRLDWKISLLCQHGSVVAELEEYGDVIEHMMTTGGPLFDRNELIQYPHYLHEGAVCIQVKIRLVADSRITPKLYKYDNNPDVPLCNYYTNLKIWLDHDSADVAFIVLDRLVFANKGIIKAQAEDFYKLCKKYSCNNPMMIDDVCPEIFQMMLRTLYGRRILPEEWKNNVQAFIFAANRYGFNNLKPEAEMWFKYLSKTK